MNTNKPPLWKQALGALTGAGVALAVYGVYSVSAPQIKAYVLTPHSWLPERSAETVTINDETMDSDNSLRIVTRTKEIMENYTEQKDSRYMDDGQTIRRYPIEGAVRVAQATSAAATDETSSDHAAAPAMYEPPSPAEIQNRWDNLQPDGNTPVANEPEPQPTSEPYVAPVVASVVTATQTPPDLPSSGFGITVITGASLGAAFIRRRKVRR